jgi:hypothetical protein
MQFSGPSAERGGRTEKCTKLRDILAPEAYLDEVGADWSSCKPSAQTVTLHAYHPFERGLRTNT